MNDHIVRKIFFNTFLVQTMSVLASLISATVNGMVTGSLLGVTPMAAYGFVTPMINVYMALGGACGTGISTVCGRIVGEGDVKKTNKVFSIGMEFTLLLSVAVMLITILCAKPLAIMFGATGDTLPMAVDFLRGYGLCAPAMFLVTTLIAVLQIDGDMKLVFASTITMTVVDVVLAVLNGLVFHKGLLGMALAVTFSFYAALVVIMLHFLNKNRILHFSLTKLNGANLLDIARYGMPYAMQQLCRAFLVISLNFVIRSLGSTDGVAVLTAVTSAGNLCMTIGTGTGRAVTLVGSVFRGERDKTSIMMLLRDSLKYSLIMNGVLSVVLFLFSGQLMPLFLRGGGDLTDIAVKAFRCFILCTVFYSFNVVLKSHYQAVRKEVMVYAYVFMDNFASIALSGFILGQLFGLDGVWFSYLVGETITLLLFSIVILIRTKRGPRFLERAALLPADFDKKPLLIYEKSIGNMEEVIEASEACRAACKEAGCSEKNAYFVSLAVEEMAGNVVRYGFRDNRHYSIDLRITKNEDGWVMRIRDNCSSFNPIDYVNLLNDEDPVAHIGIKMVKRISGSMEYINSMNMNNLIASFQG